MARNKSWGQDISCPSGYLATIVIPLPDVLALLLLIITYCFISRILAFIHVSDAEDTLFVGVLYQCTEEGILAPWYPEKLYDTLC